MEPLEENGTNGRRIVPCWRKDTIFTLPPTGTEVNGNKTGAEVAVEDVTISNAEVQEPNEPAVEASAVVEKWSERTESGENSLIGSAIRKYKRTSIEIWGTERRRHSRRMLERNPTHQSQTCDCCMGGNNSRKISASCAPKSSAAEVPHGVDDVLGQEANEPECAIGVEGGQMRGITAFGLEEDDPEEENSCGMAMGTKFEGIMTFGLEEEELEEETEAEAGGVQGFTALGLEEEEPEEDTDLVMKDTVCNKGTRKYRLPKPHENLILDAWTRVALTNNLSEFAMDFCLPADYFEVA